MLVYSFVPLTEPEQKQFNAEGSGQDSQSVRPGHLQRKVVKDHDYAYVVAHLCVYPGSQCSLRFVLIFFWLLHRTPLRTSKEGASRVRHPTKLAFAEALQCSLEEFHGVVGASFVRDVLLFHPPDPSAQSVCAVTKVASQHAPLLTSALAAGLSVHTTVPDGSNANGDASSTSTTFTTQYAGMLSAFDMAAMQAMSPIRTDSPSGSLHRPAALEPSGRAWMRSLLRPQN